MFRYIAEWKEGKYTNICLREVDFEVFRMREWPGPIVYDIENRITKDQFFDNNVYGASCVPKSRTTKPTKEIYKLEEE